LADRCAVTKLPDLARRRSHTASRARCGHACPRPARQYSGVRAAAGVTAADRDGAGRTVARANQPIRTANERVRSVDVGEGTGTGRRAAGLRGVPDNLYAWRPWSAAPCA